MRVRRIAVILLTVGLIGGAVSGFRGGAGDRTGEPVAQRMDETETDFAMGAGQEEGSKLTQALAAARRSAVVELTAEENLVVAEMGELQLLAGEAGLDLAAEQWRALANVTLRTQAVRQACEADIGAITRVAAGRWRVDVPGYPEMGARLRAKFFSEMGEALGANVAAEVIEKLGPAFEGRFAGFGVSLQTLDVVADRRDAAGGECVVTRTVMYSRDAQSGERVAMRAETYLAGREDPVVEKVRS